MEHYTPDEAERRWQDVSAAWFMQDVVSVHVSDGYEILTGPGYSEVVESFGTVVTSADISQSQDTITLLHRAHPRPWGYLTFGWGSCSGCDALEGARNLADLRALWIELYTKIEWRTTAEMQKFLREHDFGADYISYSRDAHKFVDELMQRFNVDPATAATKWEID